MTTATDVQEVKLSVHCLLKIFQHGRDFAPEFVTGLLVGMESLPSLDVTDCFPFATNLADEIEQEEYQISMMKCLRESNVDSTTLGWYQTCAFDAFVASSLAEAQLVYQSTIPNSIVLIVDTSKTSLGLPMARAFQVRANFNESLLSLTGSESDGDKFNCIFREIPVSYTESVLERVFLAQEKSQNKLPITAPISSPAEQSKFVSSMFSGMLECVDDSISEVGKLQYALRNIVKQNQNASARQRGRKEESDPLVALKTKNESVLSALSYTTCQIEQFFKLMKQFEQTSAQKLKLN